jgi:esterase
MRFIHHSVGAIGSGLGSVGIEYALDYPDAEGSPLLFVHGLSGVLTTYDEVVAQLGDLNRPIYRIDLRGHGRSDRAPGTYTVPFYAADVVAFIESVVTQPVVLIGHSLGGVIAHHVAATRPDLVLGALTEDPPLYFCDQSLFDRSMFSQVFPNLEAQMREFQSSGASFDEVRRVVANSPAPWGTPATTMFAQAIDSRADSLLLGDPDVWGPAIHGGALSGYDPNAKIECPLTILQADPSMGPAFWSEHAVQQQRSNPTRIFV